MLNTLSIVAGVLAALCLLLGFIPFLGWTNWFLTLPLAIVGLILGLLGRGSGTTLNIVVLVLAAVRLSLGGGIL